MKKIKKVDPRLRQSVFSFGCPCGTCAVLFSCACLTASESATFKSSCNNWANRREGGSIVGGGG